MVRDFFEVYGTLYRHELDTSDDCTRVYCEDCDKVLFKVDSGANVFDKDGKRIGQFRIDDKEIWQYQGDDGTRLDFGSRDLIRTEIKVFKRLLEVEHEKSQGH